MFKLRRAGLISIGVLCILTGLVLVYVLVRPGVLGQTPTLQLTIVVGMLVWPGLTYLLLRMDNMVVNRARGHRMNAAARTSVECSGTDLPGGSRHAA